MLWECRGEPRSKRPETGTTGNVAVGDGACRPGRAEGPKRPVRQPNRARFSRGIFATPSHRADTARLRSFVPVNGVRPSFAHAPVSVLAAPARLFTPPSGSAPR